MLDKLVTIHCDHRKSYCVDEAVCEYRQPEIEPAPYKDDSERDADQSRAEYAAAALVAVREAKDKG